MIGPSQLCTFAVDDFTFGVDVSEVQEVIRFQRVTPVPLADYALRGLINLRGHVVPAIDLRRQLRLPDREQDLLPINIVIRTNDGLVSLLVDEILDVVEVDTDNYEPRPEAVCGPVWHLIDSTYKLPERLLLVLDIERTVSSQLGRTGKRMNQCLTHPKEVRPVTGRAPARATHRRGSGAIRCGPVEGKSNSTLGPTTSSRAGSERTILVAEDDHSCRSALHHYFERSGYRVTEAADGPSSLRAVFQHSADLVILDLGLPGVDGPEVLAKIRRHSAVPVIVCSGRDSEEERIRMLNLGADDFVVKPFSFAELEARVRAVLRRGNSEPTVTRMEHHGLVVDRDTRTVPVNGEPIPMTRKEFDLLAFLAASPGQVFSREDLLERVWGSTEQWQGRSTVTEHVRVCGSRSSRTLMPLAGF